LSHGHTSCRPGKCTSGDPISVDSLGLHALATQISMSTLRRSHELDMKMHLNENKSAVQVVHGQVACSPAQLQAFDCDASCAACDMVDCIQHLRVAG
jgi:hypothetical protein